MLNALPAAQGPGAAAGRAATAGKTLAAGATAAAAAAAAATAAAAAAATAAAAAATAAAAAGTATRAAATVEVRTFHCQGCWCCLPCGAMHRVEPELDRYWRTLRGCAPGSSGGGGGGGSTPYYPGAKGGGGYYDAGGALILPALRACHATMRPARLSTDAVRARLWFGRQTRQQRTG